MRAGLARPSISTSRPPLTALFGQMNPKTRDAELVAEKTSELRTRLDQLERLCDGAPFVGGRVAHARGLQLRAVLLLRDAPACRCSAAPTRWPGARSSRASSPPRRRIAAVAPVLEEMNAALQEMLKGRPAGLGEHAAASLRLGDPADPAHQRRGAQVHLLARSATASTSRKARCMIWISFWFTSSSVQKNCCASCTHSK